MRFRLATAGNTGMAEGFGNGVRNLFALPMLRAQAEDEAMASGTRRQLMESQIAAHVADAALKNTESAALGSAPDVLGTVIAGRAGTDVPTFNRWRQGVQTGVQPTVTGGSGYDDIDAAIGIKPQPAIDPAVAARLVQEFQRFAPGMVNPKDLKMNDTAQAMGHYQTQDVLDQVLQGKLQPGQAGAAVAASKGTKQVDNIGNTGAGYSIHTGQGTTLDQGLRTLFGQEGEALVKQRNAAAGASGASAGLSNARRERVVGGYDKPVTILDDDTGEANITRIPTGAEPVTVGVAPKKATGKDATLQKERNRVVRDVEKEMFGASEAEITAEVDRRMGRRTPGGKPSASTAATVAPPKIDMDKAATVKARFKKGEITRAQAQAELKSLGFK